MIDIEEKTQPEEEVMQPQRQRQRRNSSIYPELDKTGRHSPKSLWREHSSIDTLTSTQWSWFCTSKPLGLWRIPFCYFKPQSWWQFVAVVMGKYCIIY